jgi:imidazolonepropionase-like amidohydrolase
MKVAKTNRIVAALVVSVCFTFPVYAQNAPDQTLFTNVHVFDGVKDKRIENANVLIEGNLIKSISTDRIDAGGATVIDGGGRTLMPGLTDTHVHLAYTSIDQTESDLRDRYVLSSPGRG